MSDEQNGSCWDEGPQQIGATDCTRQWLKCRLPSGHSGAHRDGTAEWMVRDPYNQVVAERDRAEARLARVKALHRPIPLCELCDDADCEQEHIETDMAGEYVHEGVVERTVCDTCFEEQVDYPCATILALEGEGDE